MNRERREEEKQKQKQKPRGQTWKIQTNKQANRSWRSARFRGCGCGCGCGDCQGGNQIPHNYYPRLYMHIYPYGAGWIWATFRDFPGRFILHPSQRFRVPTYQHWQYYLTSMDVGADTVRTTPYNIFIYLHFKLSWYIVISAFIRFSLPVTNKGNSLPASPAST